jgi:hypothetical protein
MLALYKAEEIYRDRLPLMDELEEGMLTVRSWFSKVDFTDWIVDFDTKSIYSLSI